ncbi:MAG: excinuclease ABC subunit UvrA [Marinilabiliales bacterium]
MPDKDNKNIIIKGAKVHNLKNIDLNIERDKLIVITGVSGSGKSSLAFDTLFAEGQRRYVESLSSYARQFLGRMSKPNVDFIHGIPPSIAIQQKTYSGNARSTVGTVTELYDYIKILFARIGKTISPVSGKTVQKHSVSGVLDFLKKNNNNRYFFILFPISIKNNEKIERVLEIISQLGYSRIEHKGKIIRITEIDKYNIDSIENFRVLVDRVKFNDEEDTISRISDSLKISFQEGIGTCIIRFEDGEEVTFSDKFEEDGIEFIEPDINLFSFNNPIGACPKCEGYGSIIGIDPDLVIPDHSLSVYSDAVVCWKGDKMKKWKDAVIFSSEKTGFPIHTPYYELDDMYKDMLWNGCKHFKGINDFFDYVESKAYKIQYRVLLSRFRGKTVCPECKGARLRKEAFYVYVDNKNIRDIVEMPVYKLSKFFDNISLNETDKLIADSVLKEIKNRLDYLQNVGLDYLTLNRTTNTLSGGEFQRIKLTTALGNGLVGALYVLDEPSIGLHPRDNDRLIRILNQLKKQKNTVLVVEHDEDIIKSSDYIIDIGPDAGINGGQVVYQGDVNKIKSLNNTYNSKTLEYLSGKFKIKVPDYRRKWKDYIEIVNAVENNLKNISVKIPLNVFTAITGVSGSGKSTLICDIFYPAIKRNLGDYSVKPGKFKKLEGSLNRVKHVELVDQNPIGKSSRSNPATYLKAYDDIRALFSKQKLSVINNFKPGHFSFNTDGGRCEQCQGDGYIKVEMQFMADVYLVCDECQGKRFKDEILEVKYNGKNIYDILDLTIDEAIEFFNGKDGLYEKRIVNKLKPLQDVGLGYLKTGQPSNTLSGGESQRIKLAYYLSKEKTEPTIFIFDEPTTGLHYFDISKLLDSFYALLKRGHTIIVIEHNLELIKCADWIIDLGPEGGDKGGEIVFEGTLEEIINCKNSYTGEYLKNKNIKSLAKK